MKSWIANTKNVTITTSQARNMTAMGVTFTNTSGKPAMSLLCSRIGTPASTPTLASRPACRNSACVLVDPEAINPNPAHERNTTPASPLNLPIYSSKEPQETNLLITLPTTTTP